MASSTSSTQNPVYVPPAARTVVTPPAPKEDDTPEGKSGLSNYLAQLVRELGRFKDQPKGHFLHAPRLLQKEIDHVELLMARCEVLSSTSAESVGNEETIILTKKFERNFVIEFPSSILNDIARQLNCQLKMVSNGPTSGETSPEGQEDDAHILVSVREVQSRAQAKIDEVAAKLQPLVVTISSFVVAEAQLGEVLKIVASTAMRRAISGFHPSTKTPAMMPFMNVSPVYLCPQLVLALNSYTSPDTSSSSSGSERSVDTPAFCRFKN